MKAQPIVLAAVLLLAASSGAAERNSHVVGADRPIRVVEGDGSVPEAYRHGPGMPSDSLAAIALVHAFFEAYDARDTSGIRGLFLPTTLVIHHNGVATDTEAICEIIEQTRRWHPRTRRLRDFELLFRGNIGLVGFKNDVTFHLPAGESRKASYRETWILERVEESWKPLRIHYSRVTAQQHSEEME